MGSNPLYQVVLVLLLQSHLGECILPIVVIYRIYNRLNGKSYIGQSRQNPKTAARRWTQHLSSAKGSSHKLCVIDAAMRKHGRDNFAMEVIDTATTLDELNTKEWFFAEMLNTYAPNGYNVRRCGDHVPPPPTSTAKVASAAKRTKAYRLLSPSNEIVEGRNVHQFCLKHGLKQSQINAVIDGTRLSSRGWRNANRKHRLFHLVNTRTSVSVTVEDVKGLRKRLSSQLGIAEHHICDLLKGARSDVDGWTVQSVSYVGEGSAALPRQRAAMSAKDAEQRSLHRSGGQMHRVLDNRLGRVYVFTNIARFCREHNLQSAKMSALVRGKCPRHHEWSLSETPLRRIHLQCANQAVVLLDGDVKGFCRERGLRSHKSMFRLISGRVPSYLGWKLVRIDTCDHTQCPVIDERLLA